MIKDYKKTCQMKQGDATYDFSLANDNQNPIIVVVNAYNYDNYEFTPYSDVVDFNEDNKSLNSLKDASSGDKKTYHGWSSCLACKNGKCIYNFEEYKARSNIMPFALFQERRNVWFVICNGQFFDLANTKELETHGNKRVEHLEIDILGQAVLAIPFIVIKNKMNYPIYHLLADTSAGKVLPLHSAICQYKPVQYAMGRLNPFDQKLGQMRENYNHSNKKFINEVSNFSYVTCEKTDYSDPDNNKYHPYIMFTGYNDWSNSRFAKFSETGEEENRLI